MRIFHVVFFFCWYIVVAVLFCLNNKLNILAVVQLHKSTNIAIVIPVSGYYRLQQTELFWLNGNMIERVYNLTTI